MLSSPWSLSSHGTRSSAVTAIILTCQHHGHRHLQVDCSPRLPCPGSLLAATTITLETQIPVAAASRNLLGSFGGHMPQRVTAAAANLWIPLEQTRLCRSACLDAPPAASCTPAPFHAVQGPPAICGLITAPGTPRHTAYSRIVWQGPVCIHDTSCVHSMKRLRLL